MNRGKLLDFVDLSKQKNEGVKMNSTARTAMDMLVESEYLTEKITHDQFVAEGECLKVENEEDDFAQMFEANRRMMQKLNITDHYARYTNAKNERVLLDVNPAGQ